MQKYTNKGSVPWHPRESRSPCKNAVNDSTIASSISWWQGWHLFHCISPMSLQDGKKSLTGKQQLATGFACSSRTVSPDEHCYRLICASCTQFHVTLGTQAFQLPQAASKQRSVPWCCRCGMFAFLLLQQSGYCGRSLSGHLHGHDLSSSISVNADKIFQPVSRMLILEIHNAVVAVPADVTSLGCHCPPNMFYASDCFFDIFHMMMTKVWYCHGHDLCPASRDLLRCPAIVWLVWIAGFLVGTAANTDGGVCLLPMTHFLQNNWPTKLLPDSVRFLVAKNILEPIQSSQAQMKECVVESWSSKTSATCTDSLHIRCHEQNQAPHVLARIH